MVSCRHKRIRHVFVDCAAIMLNQRGFSVHQAFRPDNLPSKRLPDNLVTKANSQNRYPPLKEPYRLQADPCFIQGRIPILGVCLGHQVIGQARGGEVVLAESLMHGNTFLVYHDGRTIYKNMHNHFVATRYHSLILKRETLPSCLEISAETDRGEIMGVRHREFLIEGVQFQPESILTEGGKTLLLNFLNIVREKTPAGKSKCTRTPNKKGIVVSRGVANLDY